jgi:hypothetical protein
MIARKYALTGALLILVLGMLIGRHGVPLVIQEGFGMVIHGVPDAGCRGTMGHSRKTPWALSNSDEIYIAGCDERRDIDDYVMIYCDCGPQDNTIGEESWRRVEPSDGGR